MVVLEGTEEVGSLLPLFIQKILLLVFKIFLIRLAWVLQYRKMVVGFNK